MGVSMNKGKLFIQLTLLACSFLLIVISIMFYKKLNITLEEKINVLKNQNCNMESKTREINADELLMLKNIIQVLSDNNGLYLTVKENKDEIIINATEKSKILTDRKQYDTFSSFMKNVSLFPYKIEYQHFCIGKQCGGNGIDIKLRFLKNE